MKHIIVDITWLISEPALGITCGLPERIQIDLDNVESDEYTVVSYVELALYEKYNAAFYLENNDFNLNKLIP